MLSRGFRSVDARCYAWNPEDDAVVVECRVDCEDWQRESVVSTYPRLWRCGSEAAI